MALSIRLLGSPGVRREGQPVRPRGQKAFVLLAYLLLTERAPTRQHLAGLFHPDADDPLRALRWQLNYLRRLLGAGGTVTGDPVELALQPDTMVDVHELDRLEPMALARQGVGELLDGADLSTLPELDAWVTAERHRLSRLVTDRLRAAADAALRRQRLEDAVVLAERAVRCNPLDEHAQELLIRALARNGDLAGARRQRDACVALFRRELGRPPGRNVVRSADMPTAQAVALPGAVLTRSELEAGRAAIAAGAIHHGVEQLRRAAADASTGADPALSAYAHAELGEAIVHAVGSQEPEGRAALQRALDLAEEHDLAETAAKASTELAFVHIQAGDPAVAEALLHKAQTLAVGHDALLAQVLSIRGMALSDRGQHRDAAQALSASAEIALRADKHRQAAWALSLLARAYKPDGQPSMASRACNDSLELVRAERWIAFQPWPQSIAADLALAHGRTQEAADRFQHAYALACELGDHCWQAMAARGMGVALLHNREPKGALAWLREARRHSSWELDRYVWIDGYVLDTACATVATVDHRTAVRLARELEHLAERARMPDLARRSHQHLARLGAPPAQARPPRASNGSSNEPPAPSTGRPLGRQIDE